MSNIPDINPLYTYVETEENQSIKGLKKASFKKEEKSFYILLRRVHR